MSDTKNQVVTQKTIVDSVLTKVEQFKESGELITPENYIPANALKSAYLILSEAVDKDKNPVLQSCSQASIANSLLDMVVQGLSPMKNQCYFIPYGGKLQMSRSYLGSIAAAKRAGMKSIVANVVFTKDKFDYKIDPKTGLFEIIKHDQVMENIDIKTIRGAYAITTMEDGTTNLTVMTLAQIRTSWLQGYAKGNSGAHTNFTDEMCKKTVINRACKVIINGSVDVVSVPKAQEETEEITHVPVNQQANANELEVVDLTEVVAEKVEKPVTQKAGF